jgi:predicted membrane channel-forming protein YqfA (hemolysin III family)
VLTGYRHPARHATVAACVRSLGRWHAETANIFTHLAALAAWMWVATDLFAAPHFAAAPTATRALLYYAVAAGAVTFACSAAAHTLHVMSHAARVAAWRVDHAAILLLLYGRGALDAWFAFGHHALGAFAGVMAAVLVTFAWTATHLWHDRTDSLMVAGTASVIAPLGCLMLRVHAYDAWVAVLDALPSPPLLAGEVGRGLGLGAAGGTQPPLALLLLEAPTAWLQSGAAWCAVSSACALLGSVLYYMHWPERLAPGRFDRLGSSHQVWHLLSAGACFAAIRAAHQFLAHHAAVQAPALASAAAAAAAEALGGGV